MSVGETLRRERTRLGIDLDTLARETRIQRRYLDAIENNAPDQCPGAFFYRSFVRQYATHLGLDPAEIEADLERVQPVIVTMPQPEIRETFPLKSPDPIVAASNRVYFGGSARVWGSAAALVAVIVGCSMFYAWWRNQSAAQDQAALVSTPPTVAEPVRTSPPPVEPAAPAEAVPNATAPAADSSTPAESATAAAPAADAKVFVAVASKEPSWISLNTDGKQVFSGTLAPGQTQTAGGISTARMRVGNAGGIEVTYNGKAIGPVGPRGQVRTVVFTPDGYQILPPGGAGASAPGDAAPRVPGT